MSTPAKIQIPGNVAGSGSRLDVALDSGSAISVPTTDGAGGPIKAGFTDSSGTPGNCTCSNVTGKVAIAQGATAVVVTNTLVTTASVVLVTKLSLDSVLVDFKAVCTANTITITGNGAANAACYFQFALLTGV